jgi:hypothetical protein
MRKLMIMTIITLFGLSANIAFAQEPLKAPQFEQKAFISKISTPILNSAISKDWSHGQYSKQWHDLR